MMCRSILLWVLWVAVLSTVFANNTPLSSEEMLEAWQESSQLWLEKKEECADTYRYAVYARNGPTAQGRTWISVKEGQVSTRTHEVVAVDLEQYRHRQRGWSEEEGELGQHKEGAPPATLDQLYQDCRNIITTKNNVPGRLLEKGNYGSIVLDFSVEGLLFRCEFIEHGCSSKCVARFIRHIDCGTP